MQEEVRVALQNLQGIFDEGFMTQAEYNTRRKAIIDGATSVAASAAASKPGKTAAEKRAAASTAAPKSVFDRLGGAKPTPADKWGHEGFTQLYGGAAAKAGTKGKTGIALYQPPGSRSVIKKTTDLRDKLGGGDRAAGRGKATGRGRGAKLPEKCPW